MLFKHQKGFSLPVRLLFWLFCLVVYATVVSCECPDGTSGFSCTQCPEGCDVCDTSTSICDTCTVGYYLDSSDLCTTCPNNCLQCQSASECTKCTPGYDSFFNENGQQECQFLWWKWFLIIFGILLGIFLLWLIVWCIRQKLKEEDAKNQEIQYEMKPHEVTEDRVQ